MAKSLRLIPIKWSLLRNVIVIVVCLSLSSLATIAILGGRTAEKLSVQFVDQTVKVVEMEVNAHIRPAEERLLLTADLLLNTDLNPANAGDMNAMFMRMMRNFPDIDTVQIADDAGRAYSLVRRRESWAARVTRLDAAGLSCREKIYDELGALEGDFACKTAEDPKTTLWYLAGLATTPGKVAWSEPFRYAGRKGKIIAVSTRVRPEGKTPFVLSLAIRLRDIGLAAETLSPSPNGFVAFLTLEGEVIGVPRGVAGSFQNGQEAFMRLAGELGSPVLAQSFRDWQELLGNDGHPLTVVSGGEKWLVRFRPLRIGEADLFLTGVLVPERDFMESVKRQGALILILAALATIAAGISAVFLARRFSRPLEVLAEQTEHICALVLDEEIKPLPSNIDEVQTLGKAHAKMHQTLSSFVRYIPVEVIRQLMLRGEPAVVGGKARELTILFLQATRYVALTDTMEAQDLFDHLSRYFQTVTTVLERHGGTIDKYLGGGLMAFWNAPADIKDHSLVAVRAVWECAQAIDAANREWLDAGLPVMTTWFGLHTGEAVVGNVGSSERLSYTALGDAVNLTSRLEHLNGLYGTAILISETVKAAIGASFLTRQVDTVAVKGKTQGVPVFELLGPADEVKPPMRDFAAAYEQALRLYLGGRFAQAGEAFAALAAAHPERVCVALLLSRCRELAGHPPAQWDGVWRLTRKYEQGRQ